MPQPGFGNAMLMIFLVAVPTGLWLAVGVATKIQEATFFILIAIAISLVVATAVISLMLPTTMGRAFLLGRAHGFVHVPALPFYCPDHRSRCLGGLRAISTSWRVEPTACGTATPASTKKGVENGTVAMTVISAPLDWVGPRKKGPSLVALGHAVQGDMVCRMASFIRPLPVTLND